MPPAEVIDKHVYAPWDGTDLHRSLKSRGIDTLVITGGETDVCVLATVLGAVDRGYRVVVAHDALCSSSDETHDASLAVYHSRYGVQVEAVTTDVILANWETTTIGDLWRRKFRRRRLRMSLLERPCAAHCAQAGEKQARTLAS